MGKRTTKSWDKRQERRLRSYLKANGYVYVCSKGGHDKYRSTITGHNTEVNNNINKMVWLKIIKEVAEDLTSKGYNYVSYERVR
jgi:hypothetical protein